MPSVNVRTTTARLLHTHNYLPVLIAHTKALYGRNVHVVSVVAFCRTTTARLLHTQITYTCILSLYIPRRCRGGMYMSCGGINLIWTTLYACCIVEETFVSCFQMILHDERNIIKATLREGREEMYTWAGVTQHMVKSLTFSYLEAYFKQI